MLNHYLFIDKEGPYSNREEYMYKIWDTNNFLLR